MPFRKFILIPFFIGVLAFILGLFDQSFSQVLAPANNFGFAFISFQAWAVYFFAGCNVKGGIKSYTNYLTGIVAAISMILFTQNTSALLGKFASPMSLLLGCLVFLSLERVPAFNLLPPMFISAGMFFGLMTYMPGASLLNVSIIIAIYSFLGLFLGFITICCRTWYEKQYAANHPAAEVK
ncbi:MAG: DUF1097 domain-containing protein [Lawsonibacter sp.]